MKPQVFKVKVTFTEPLLATGSGNPEIHEEFIASRADTTEKLKEEIAAVTPPTEAEIQQQIEKQSTIFARDKAGLFLWDYQFKGFLKEAIGVLCELGEVPGLTKWTFKRAVDSCVFVSPRRLYLRGANGEAWKAAAGTNQRPLRAETMQGDRVALARSEELPAGTFFDAEITLLVSSNSKSKFASLDADIITLALGYGKLKGIGQWRNASYGRFECEVK